MKKIKKIAQKAMGTINVRVDVRLEKHVTMVVGFNGGICGYLALCEKW
ncbi:putative ribosomal protein L31e [Helianthus annuus]|nr:putative ribosomal protein L31e [Helianthus annuus]